MAGRQLDHRKIAWAAALAVIGASLILSDFSQPTAQARPLTRHSVADMVCSVVCDTCSPQTYECHDDGGGGGYATPPGGGGNPTNVPPGGGGTPGAPPTAQPWPTLPPPTGAPAGGYYVWACGFVGSLCSTSYANTVYYVAPDGRIFPINYTCIGACATPQPPPVVHPDPAAVSVQHAPAAGQWRTHATVRRAMAGL